MAQTTTVDTRRTRGSGHHRTWTFLKWVDTRAMWAKHLFDSQHDPWYPLPSNKLALAFARLELHVIVAA